MPGTQLILRLFGNPTVAINPKYNKTSYYCPSNRCGQLCNVASGVTSNDVQKIGLECNIHK